MSTTVTPEQGSSQVSPERTGNAARTINLNHRDPTQGTPPATSTQPSGATTGQSPEGQRLRQRISLLLGQQTGLSRVMLVVLTGALIFGLIGFAAHIMWIVAVIVIALGLGYVAADSRRGSTDAVNQRQEDDLDTARGG
jgi:hypothetical protein